MERGPCGSLASVAVAPGLWSTGVGLVALRPVGTSGSGIKPVSPELAGGFFTTEPPGKPPGLFLD